MGAEVWGLASAGRVSQDIEYASVSGLVVDSTVLLGCSGRDGVGTHESAKPSRRTGIVRSTVRLSLSSDRRMPAVDDIEGCRAESRTTGDVKRHYKGTGGR